MAVQDLQRFEQQGHVLWRTIRTGTKGTKV